MPQGAKKRAPANDSFEVQLARRILTAFDTYNAGRSPKMTQAELGQAVARKLKRSKAFTQGTVSAWMSTSKPSDLTIPMVNAIAAVLGADPSWLGFGVRED